MWYGVDEQACYGVVSSKKLANEWKKRGDGNDVIEFVLDKLPKVERWRDDKMFPHAPRTGPATNLSEQIEDYYAHVMLSDLMSTFKFASAIKP